MLITTKNKLYSQQRKKCDKKKMKKEVRCTSITLHKTIINPTALRMLSVSLNIG